MVFWLIGDDDELLDEMNDAVKNYQKSSVPHPKGSKKKDGTDKLTGKKRRIVEKKIPGVGKKSIVQIISQLISLDIIKFNCHFLFI